MSDDEGGFGWISSRGGGGGDNERDREWGGGGRKPLPSQESLYGSGDRGGERGGERRGRPRNDEEPPVVFSIHRAQV